MGDDDQNIYAFSGSSTKYIKRFEEDYRASPSYMTENYRSSKHIIAAANSVIGPADQRMKEDRPITVNRDRTREHPGGEWARIDPVTQGKVQILPAGDGPIAQAQLVVGELRRMAGLDPEWDWSNCAIIARNMGPAGPGARLVPVDGDSRSGIPGGFHGHLAAAGNSGAAQPGPRPDGSG